MTSQKHYALADLAAEVGTPVPCAGNLPLDLGDPECVWFIEKGSVDLFLVESEAGREQSAPEHLLRADAGRFLPGVAPQVDDTTLALIAKGLPGAVLRRLPVTSLASIANDELATNVDAWIMDLSAMLSKDAAYRPRFDALIESATTLEARSGTLSARRGVVWVSRPPRGSSLFLSLIDPADGAQNSGTGTAPHTVELARSDRRHAAIHPDVPGSC